MGAKLDRAYLAHADLSRYACLSAFCSRGLFVGSGPVEAWCKSIIAQRLKSSGMR